MTVSGSPFAQCPASFLICCPSWGLCGGWFCRRAFSESYQHRAQVFFVTWVHRRERCSQLDSVFPLLELLGQCHLPAVLSREGPNFGRVADGAPKGPLEQIAVPY